MLSEFKWKLDFCCYWNIQTIRAPYPAVQTADEDNT